MPSAVVSAASTAPEPTAASTPLVLAANFCTVVVPPFCTAVSLTRMSLPVLLVSITAVPVLFRLATMPVLADFSLMAEIALARPLGVPASVRLKVTDSAAELSDFSSRV